MAEPFALRPLTLDDAVSLAPMFQAPRTDLAQDSVGALGVGRALAHEIGKPGADPGLSFFALVDGRPVAMCLCRLAGENGFVKEIGVDPMARRRGIPSALLNLAMVELARLGAKRGELD